MFVVSSKFIGSFRLVENINYNLSGLALLYRYYEGEDEDGKRFLRKPIIVLLVSIIEAVLHDYHTRIRTFTREGVANLTQSVVDYISAKRLDELEKYVASARKHNLFGTDPEFTRYWMSYDAFGTGYISKTRKKTLSPVIATHSLKEERPPQKWLSKRP